METRVMTPFFASTFSILIVTFISESKNTQNSFPCGCPFGLIFCQKLQNRTAHHSFLESRHNEAIKNLYCFVHLLEPNINFLGSLSSQSR